MHFPTLTLPLLLALSTTALSQDIDSDEVPFQCQSVCSSIVTLARNCDNTTNDDNAELQCLCTGTDASTLVPLCAACISQNGDRDNDVNDILTSCSFTSTTYVSSAASSILSSVSSQSGSSPASTSASVTSTGTSASTSASGTQSSGATSASEAALSSSTGGAPVQTVAAAAGLGALGLALLL